MEGGAVVVAVEAIMAGGEAVAVGGEAAGVLTEPLSSEAAVPRISMAGIPSAMPHPFTRVITRT